MATRDREEFAIDAGDAGRRSGSPPTNYWSLGCLVFILLGTTVAILLPVVSSGPSDGGGRRSTCINNQHNLALALEAYRQARGHYPPPYIADKDGRPMHSWRVLILPYIDCRYLYDAYNFDEPWDGPNNIKLLDQMPEIYACPSAPHGSDFRTTNYLAIVGNQTMWPPQGGRKREDVTDGLDNTIMLVESSNCSVPWTEPRDLDFATMDMQINSPSQAGISSEHPGGFCVTFADGRTAFFSENLLPDSLRAAITIAGGEKFSLD